MGKKLIALLPIVLIIACFATACNTTKYKVSFYNDQSLYKSVQTDGKTIVMPEDPSKENYEFDGWYLDKDTWQQPFGVSSGLITNPLTSDISVYAKWVEKDSPDKSKLGSAFTGMAISEDEKGNYSILDFTTTIVMNEDSGVMFYPAGYSDEADYAYHYVVDEDGKEKYEFYLQDGEGGYEYTPSGTGEIINGNRLVITLKYDGNEYKFDNTLYKLTITYGTAGSKQTGEYMAPSGYSLMYPLLNLPTDGDILRVDGEEYTYEEFVELKMPAKNCTVDITPNRVLASQFNGLVSAKSDDGKTADIRFTSTPVVSGQAYCGMVITYEGTNYNAAYVVDNGKLALYAVDSTTLTAIGDGVIAGRTLKLNIMFDGIIYSFKCDLYRLNVSSGGSMFTLWASPGVLVKDVMVGVQLKVGKGFSMNSKEYTAADFETVTMPSEDCVLTIDAEAIDKDIENNPFNGAISTADGNAVLRFSNEAYGENYVVTLVDRTNMLTEYLLYSNVDGVTTLNSISDEGELVKLTEGTIGETENATHMEISFTYNDIEYSFSADIYELYITYLEHNGTKVELDSVFVQGGIPMIYALDDVLLESDTIEFESEKYTVDEFSTVTMPTDTRRITISPNAFTYGVFSGILQGETATGDTVIAVFQGEDQAEDSGVSIAEAAIVIGDETLSGYYVIDMGKIMLFTVEDGEAVQIGEGYVSGNNLVLNMYTATGELIELSGSMHIFDLTYKCTYTDEDDEEQTVVEENTIWVAEGYEFSDLLDFLGIQFGNGAYVAYGDGLYRTAEELAEFRSMAMPSENVEIVIEGGDIGKIQA